MWNLDNMYIFSLFKGKLWHHSRAGLEVHLWDAILTWCLGAVGHLPTLAMPLQSGNKENLPKNCETNELLAKLEQDYQRIIIFFNISAETMALP